MISKLEIWFSLKKIQSVYPQLRHTVHAMNSLYFDRGNSICWWHFPNASGPREGLPCCSTQGVFLDQDFSSQRRPQRRNLCECAEEGLEGRARAQTHLTCKSSTIGYLSPECDVCGPSTIFSLWRQTIKCLLIHPNPESALNEEAGRLLLEDYAEYESRARLLTEIHAMGGTSGAPQDPNDGPQPKKHAGDPTKRAGPSVPAGLGNSANGASSNSNSSSNINNVVKKKADKKRALRRL